MPQLYTKEMKGKRIVYVPFEMPVDTGDNVVLNFTDKQLITAVASLGIVLTNLMRTQAKTSVIQNRIKSVETEIIRMFKDTGAKIDPETADWFCTAWNKTMKEMVINS